MTDLFLCPIAHLVNQAMAPREIRAPRAPRPERCTIHREGQFFKHACPDCRDNYECKSTLDHGKSKTAVEAERSRLVHSAIVNILKTHTPATYGEMIFLIEQRCGVRVKTGSIWKILLSMRRHGLTDFHITSRAEMRRAKRSQQ